MINFQGFGYTGDHEEGQMVEGIPAFDISSKGATRKLTRKEAEALASKEGEQKSERGCYCVRPDLGTSLTNRAWDRQRTSPKALNTAPPRRRVRWRRECHHTIFKFALSCKLRNDCVSGRLTFVCAGLWVCTLWRVRFVCDCACVRRAFTHNVAC